MHCLKTKHPGKCHSYLKLAEEYSKHSAHMQLVTHNNWSCFYKKTGRPAFALAHIKKAIRLADKLSLDHHISADSYLNMGVILAEFGEHRKALLYADRAIRCLEMGLQEMGGKTEAKIRDRRNVLAIAKFNKATELEHLSRWEDCLH